MRKCCLSFAWNIIWVNNIQAEDRLFLQIDHYTSCLEQYFDGLRSGRTPVQQGIQTRYRPGRKQQVNKMRIDVTGNSSQQLYTDNGYRKSNTGYHCECCAFAFRLSILCNQAGEQRRVCNHSYAPENKKYYHQPFWWGGNNKWWNNTTQTGKSEGYCSDVSCAIFLGKIARGNTGWCTHSNYYKWK